MINNLFFDTEFTGLKKDADLISIGICDENGNIFYAECNNFDHNKIATNLIGSDHFIENNVFPNLCFNNLYSYYKQIQNNINSQSLNMTFIKDNKDNISKYLLKFLDNYDQIQFISDCCHYDFVLLIDLFEHALNLPEKINPYCHDINIDIANYLNITETEAFNVSRINLANSFNISNIDIGKQNFLNLYHKQQHNALIDAYDIAKIYLGINKNE